MKQGKVALLNTTHIEGGPIAPSHETDTQHPPPSYDGLTELPDVSASDEAKQLALAIASAGLDKKATGIEIIDVAFSHLTGNQINAPAIVIRLKAHVGQHV